MALARMYSDVWKKIIARNICVNCLDPVSVKISVIDSLQGFSSDLKKKNTSYRPDKMLLRSIITQRKE